MSHSIPSFFHRPTKKQQLQIREWSITDARSLIACTIAYNVNGGKDLAQRLDHLFFYGSMLQGSVLIGRAESSFTRLSTEIMDLHCLWGAMGAGVLL